MKCVALPLCLVVRTYFLFYISKRIFNLTFCTCIRNECDFSSIKIQKLLLGCRVKKNVVIRWRCRCVYPFWDLHTPPTNVKSENKGLANAVSSSAVAPTTIGHSECVLKVIKPTKRHSLLSSPLKNQKHGKTSMNICINIYSRTKMPLTEGHFCEVEKNFKGFGVKFICAQWDRRHCEKNREWVVEG